MAAIKNVCMCEYTYTSIATGSGHPNYPCHLGHFLSGSKWVLPGHTNMPDLDL